MNSHDDDICVGSISTVELVKMQRKIESLTVNNDRLRVALEEAILYCQFIDLSEKWQNLLKETGEK